MRLLILLGCLGCLAHIGPVLAETCRNLPPGINRLAFGVDITTLTLQPLDFTEPDGYKGVIIEFTCNKEQHTPKEHHHPRESYKENPFGSSNPRNPYYPESPYREKSSYGQGYGMYNPQEKKTLSEDTEIPLTKSSTFEANFDKNDADGMKIEDDFVLDDSFTALEKRMEFPYPKDPYMPHGGGGGFGGSYGHQGHYHDPSTSNFARYTLPDQVAGIAPVPGGFMRAQAKTYKTTSDLTSKMSANAGVSHKLGMFSGSSSYTALSQQITKHFKEITEVFAYVSSYEVSLNPDVVLELTDNVKKVVDKLPESFAESPVPYYRFISAFGTHYFAKGKLGGLVKQVFETSREYYKKHSDTDAQLQARLQYQQMVDGNGGVSNNNVQTDDDFSKYTTTHESFMGGDLKFKEENGIKAWQDTVHQKPWVFGANLAPIHDLIRSESKQLAMKQAVAAHLDRAYLKEIGRLLNSIENRAIVKDLLTEVTDQLNKAIPDHDIVVELGKKVEVIPPDWKQLVRLCYKYNWISTKSRKYVYENAKCAGFGEYTYPYYDNTQSIYTDEIQIKDILTGKFKFLTITNTRQLSWSLQGPNIADEWFTKVEFCYKYEATGAKKQCNEGKSLSQVCAPMNSFTPMYVDGTNDAPGGCKMSWQLKAPTDAPLWFLSTQLCLKWDYMMVEKNGECGLGANETLCAFVNNWTPFYLDDTDSRGQVGSGCSMQWIIK